MCRAEEVERRRDGRERPGRVPARVVLRAPDLVLVALGVQGFLALGGRGGSGGGGDGGSGLGLHVNKELQCCLRSRSRAWSSGGVV